MIDRLTGRTFAAQAVRRWGYWAYARMCAKAGVDFVDCYVGVFGRMPRLAHVADSQLNASRFGVDPYHNLGNQGEQNES